jgi:hypothetical protein
MADYPIYAPLAAEIAWRCNMSRWATNGLKGSPEKRLVSAAQPLTFLNLVETWS